MDFGIVVSMNKKEEDIVVYPDGRLVFHTKEYRCALGRGGVVENKNEGDGATPAGCFPIREVFYRADRLGTLRFPFPTHVITQKDAWCEDSYDSRYNTRIEVDTQHPESLWRNDVVYDVVAVLGHNDDPPVPGKGSAIFLHVAREGYTPTAGCIALALPDVLDILKKSTSTTRVCVETKIP